MTPFRSEKNTNWEGAFRVPARGPLAGPHQAGAGLQRDLSRPRLVPDAARGGRRAGRQGHACSRASEGRRARPQGASRRLQPAPVPRPGKRTEVRAEGVLLLQRRWRAGRRAIRELEVRLLRAARAQGTLRDLGASRSPACALPKMYNLRMDPYERADITSNTYYDWMLRHAFLARARAGAGGAVHVTFKEFPPRQTAVELQRRSDHGTHAEGHLRQVRLTTPCSPTLASGVREVRDRLGARGGPTGLAALADVVLVTHEHLDHNGVGAIGGDPVILRSTAGTPGVAGRRGARRRLRARRRRRHRARAEHAVRLHARRTAGGASRRLRPERAARRSRRWRWAPSTCCSSPSAAGRPSAPSRPPRSPPGSAPRSSCRCTTAPSASTSSSPSTPSRSGAERGVERSSVSRRSSVERTATIGRRPARRRARRDAGRPGRAPGRQA